MGKFAIKKVFWWAILPIILSVIFGSLTLAYANPPSANPILTNGTVTNSTVILTWTQSAGNHNHDIFRCLGAGCVPTVQVANNVDSPYEDSGLTPNTTYRFQVDETHSNTQLFSNIIEVTTASSGGGPPPSGETSPPINFEVEQVGQQIRLKWDYHPDDTVDPDKIVISREEINDPGFKKLAKEKDHKETIKNKKTGLISDFYLDSETGSNPGPPLVNHTYRYEIDVKYLNNDKHVVESDFIRLTPAEGVLMSGAGHAIEQPQGLFSFPPFLLGFFAIADDGFLIETSVNPQNESFLFAIEPIPLPEGLDAGCDEVLEVIHHIDMVGSEIDVRATIIETNATGSFVQHQTILGLSDSDKRHFARHFFIAFEDQIIQNYEDLTVQLDFTQFEGVGAKMHVHDLNFYVPQDRSSC